MNLEELVQMAKKLYNELPSAHDAKESAYATYQTLSEHLHEEEERMLHNNGDRAMADWSQQKAAEAVASMEASAPKAKPPRPEPTRAPRVGDFVCPDGWDMGELLTADSGFSDESFPGCQFRLKGICADYAVNVVMTGRIQRDGYYRCRIEFVGDGEPSTFSGGRIHFHS